MAAIKVDELHHEYNDRGRAVTAVDHVSFEVEENEFYTLLGPSGCGKTTTLRCLAGLEVPTSGTIEMDDVVVFSSRGVVPTHRRDIGMVFQDYAVWPHMSVFENVAFPLHTGKRLPGRVIKDRVHEALELVNMAEYVDRKATQLSGGQQQRLSLARALVRQPKVLLLDEPLSNLDAKLREQMRKELRFLQRRVKVTTIFVTHDQVEALSMSNRIAVMNKGVIIQVGTPREIYQTPHSEFVAAFVGATSFIQGTVTTIDTDAAQVTLDTQIGKLVSDLHIELGVGDLVTVAIRPEAMRVSSDPFPGPNNLEAIVDIGLFVGDAVDYHVHVGDELLRVKGSPRSHYRRRDKVFIDVPPAECVLILRADEGPAELARPEDTLEPVMIDTTA
ncbi:MAG: iron(III) transport system ATP-binding protein [Pseudonocardiales bacterium]|jgi:iron(III) transport system ATP-binding protein|nr:Fe3+/spermidine/putrescine transporter ATP-binding protein [Pseudonocardiales bacterium]MDT4909973.1 iron(III) transport system ATP-binding protein [Pseudonocardiales bacterium]MDT4962075.1 iron(III) transport system ATP-binding protein [Pseudonocardiales bacterium]MDT4975881.1 iron(III) transport system ATP-binding protein [Pseudonocardiales bacterium]MDT4980633.1 iron(III) transport system ATP-binding protein [Pseudonocardiales bacterium]